MKGIKEDLLPSKMEEIFGMTKHERQKWTDDGRLHVASYKHVYYPASRGGWTYVPLYDCKQVRRLTPERIDKWREKDKETGKKIAQIARKKRAKLDAKRRLKRIALRKLLKKPIRTAKTICLDTETTGLMAGYNGIVDLAIIDSDGETLFHHLIRPSSKAKWTKEASHINGIHPADVETELTMKDYLPIIQTIIDGADTIVAYNAAFDLPFLQAEGVKIPERIEVSDVMLDYAIIHGEWSAYFGDWKWQKLTTCAAAYGYEWTGAAHGALADALATIYCYHQIESYKLTEEYEAMMEKRREEADEADDETDGVDWW